MARGDLGGRTVAVLQNRNASVMADLVRRRGGNPLVVPTMREETVEELQPLREVLEEVVTAPLDLAIFQTGVGTTRLFELAAELGLDGELRERVLAATIVARGPKPLNVLLKLGLRADLRTTEPHTTTQLLPLVDGDHVGHRVLVQHHGAPNKALVDFLAARGASILEAHTYRWALPEDLSPAHHFFGELASGRIDVVTFTSASQVENLFMIADQAGCAEDLSGWLRASTKIASVGPTTSSALAEHGLPVAIEPTHPKMAPLVDAIAAHFATGDP